MLSAMTSPPWIATSLSYRDVLATPLRQRRSCASCLPSRAHCRQQRKILHILQFERHVRTRAASSCQPVVCPQLPVVPNTLPLATSAAWDMRDGRPSSTQNRRQPSPSCSDTGNDNRIRKEFTLVEMLNMTIPDNCKVSTQTPQQPHQRRVGTVTKVCLRMIQAIAREIMHQNDAAMFKPPTTMHTNIR